MSIERTQKLQQNSYRGNKTMPLKSPFINIQKFQRSNKLQKPIQ